MKFNINIKGRSCTHAHTCFPFSLYINFPVNEMMMMMMIMMNMMLRIIDDVCGDDDDYISWVEKWVRGA